MKTILVTGANGQLGKCLASTAKNYPAKFIFLSTEDLNITDSAALSSFFGANKIDWCINCAAFTAVDLAENEAEKADLVNSKAVKNLSKECKSHRAKLIHISTDFIFDGELNIPYSEEDQPRPLNVYGQSKLNGENHIKEVFDDYYIIRTSWLYSEYGSNFVKTILGLSEIKDELFVVKDQIGAPTYGLDLANAIHKIIDYNKLPFGTYNFCNNGEVSWYQFAEQILKEQNISINLNPVLTEDLNNLVKRPKYSVLDNTKIKRYLHIKIPNWDDSLKTCLDRIRSINKI